MDPSQLPNDPEALKCMLLEERRRVATAERRAASAEHEKAELQAELSSLREELVALKRRHFGRTTERVSSKQLSFLDEDTAPADALAAAKAAEAGTPRPTTPKRTRRRSKHGRRRLPSHLPRVPVTSGDPGQTVCPCCDGELRVVGSDVSERLEFIPGHFVALEITRTKRACPRCPSAGIFVQPAPAFALERALPADGLVARVITDKFATGRRTAPPAEPAGHAHEARGRCRHRGLHHVRLAEVLGRSAEAPGGADASGAAGGPGRPVGRHWPSHLGGRQEPPHPRPAVEGVIQDPVRRPVFS